MQIVETKQEKLKREYKVTLTAGEVETKINERLEELGRTVKIPGFRPGKVPLAVLKTKYGKAIMGEVLEHAVNDSTLKAINENKLRPAMQPKIEVKTFDETQGLEYTMAVELLPEVKVADLTKIEIEKLEAKPEDKIIKEALEGIAKRHKTTEVVSDKAHKSKTGDIVVIDFDGTVDGTAFPGMKGEAHHLELGSKSFIDTFEDQLTGVKTGDKKTVTVTFPTPYANAALAGKKAEFKVEVKEIRTATVPAIDEEFAKKLGFESLDKVKQAITDQIQAEYNQMTRLNVKRDLLDQLDETHDFPVPAGMVDAEFQGIWQQVKGQNHQHDHAHDHNHVHDESCNYGKDHGAESEGTEEEKQELKDIAHRRVKLGLVLAEIGRENKIEVTVQELQQAVITEARRYPGQEKEVFDYFQKNRQALESLRAPIYEDKVIDFILERSKISSRSVTIEELNKASEEETSGKTAKGKSAKGKEEKSKKAESGETKEKKTEKK